MNTFNRPTLGLNIRVWHCFNVFVCLLSSEENVMFKRVISYAILPMDEPSNQKQPDLNIGLPPDMPASDSNNSGL